MSGATCAQMSAAAKVVGQLSGQRNVCRACESANSTVVQSCGPWCVDDREEGLQRQKRICAETEILDCLTQRLRAQSAVMIPIECNRSILFVLVRGGRAHHMFLGDARDDVRLAALILFCCAAVPCVRLAGLDAYMTLRNSAQVYCITMLVAARTGLKVQRRVFKFHDDGESENRWQAVLRCAVSCKQINHH